MCYRLRSANILNRLRAPLEVETRGESIGAMRDCDVMLAFSRTFKSTLVHDLAIAVDVSTFHLSFILIVFL